MITSSTPVEFLNRPRCGTSEAIGRHLHRPLRFLEVMQGRERPRRLESLRATRCEVLHAGRPATHVEICWLTSWKRTAGHEWLAEVHVTCLAQCLRDQDAAFRNFFASRTRYPCFKRKNTYGSVRFQDVGAAWVRGRLSLPKLGALKLAESLLKVERPDLMTLTRDAYGKLSLRSSGPRPSSRLRYCRRPRQSSATPPD
jgi:transposase